MERLAGGVPELNLIEEPLLQLISQIAEHDFHLGPCRSVPFEEIQVVRGGCSCGVGIEDPGQGLYQVRPTRSWFAHYEYVARGLYAERVKPAEVPNVDLSDLHTITYLLRVCSSA